MDTIYQEIGVPRKQIRETQRSDRFIVITNRSWIKCLIQQKQIAKFPCHPGFDEWPTKNDDLGNDWCLTYFVVSCKSNFVLNLKLKMRRKKRRPN